MLAAIRELHPDLETSDAPINPRIPRVRWPAPPRDAAQTQ
jgi:hypothetical protein